jgi:hypothetical protein
MEVLILFMAVLGKLLLDMTLIIELHTQVVNGQRLKYYISRDSYNEDVDVIQW